MSAIINPNKMKFSVFGKGFEDERGDSGEGGEADSKDIGHSAEFAVIDATEQYFWIAQNSGGFPLESCGKRRLDTLEEVEQSIVPNYVNRATVLFHPCNVENNYGVALQWNGTNTDIYLFNLTDDTLYGQGTFGSWIGGNMEAVLVNRYIYFVHRIYGRSNPCCYRLNMDTMEMVTMGQTWNTGTCGFVDNDTIYGFYPPEWFHQTKNCRGMSYNFSNQWVATAQRAGGSGFPNIDQRGMAGNGYIYLPSYCNGAWKFGVYNGNSTPNLEKPKPIRTFGKFSSYPDFGSYNPPQYSDKKKRAAVCLSTGLYVTDFNECDLITDEIFYARAISEHYVITEQRNGWYTRIFKYR